MNLNTGFISSHATMNLAGSAQSRHHCPGPDAPDDPDSTEDPDFPSRRDNRGGPDDTSDPDFGGRDSGNTYSGPDGTYDGGGCYL
jgi:hypothetical protein